MFSKTICVLLVSLVYYFASVEDLFRSACSDAASCEDCVSSSSCRWCKRDNKCHREKSLRNSCKRAENIVNKSHCNDKPSHYDSELSLKMLLLSSAAYDPQQPQICLNNALPSSNFLLRKVVTKDCDMYDHECSGSCMAISHVEKAIAVAFRGTVELSQVLAQFVKAFGSPKTPFIGGKVQSYWKNAFDVLWRDMEGEVRALVSAYPSYQIWVTGHSLGGAIASIGNPKVRILRSKSRFPNRTHLS